MLSSIRKFSTSFLGKIVIGLIAVAFVVGFGMSGSFGGKQNIVAEVNGEKISSQEFVEYLQQRVNLTKEDVLRAGGKSELLQQVLMNYISEKIISIESEKKGLLLTEKSLLKTLVEDRKFQKDGKFSETKYEKFMLSNGLTKVFYENLIKETEIKGQLLNFYSGGLKIPSFSITDLYLREYSTKQIDYINLTKLYENDQIKEDKIKEYYESNKNTFKEIYKNINYLKLTPELLIGKKIFDEEFFKKIDAIENSILDGNTFESIVLKNKNKVTKIGFINNQKLKEDGVEFKGIDKKSFDEMFKATETNSPKFINIDNNYYIFEILETKEKLLTLENKELKKMIISQIKIIDQIEKIGKILRDIGDNKFNKNNMIKLAQKNNSSVNTLTIKNINDDTKFNKKLLEEIYKYGKNDIFVISGEDVNYLVRIENEINPKIDIKSENYKKYIARAESEYIKTIYQSYDNYINKNYKIEIKNAVLKRMENSF
tara:strand:- start:254 stop:1708 length:1455 start_codon:yes stop_codon:yes gene_type:complete